MDHEREVRIRLTVEADEQAKAQAERGIKQTLNQVESAAKSASRTATEAVTSGFREIKRAQTGIVSDWGSVIRDAGRYNMSLKALSAGLGKADQASLQLYLANQKVGGSMDTSADAMRKYTQTSMRGRVAMEQLGIQFSRATSAAFQMARGVAFLAASNDEDFQKMVRWLVTIQGGFDALSGGVRLVSTLSRMWRSYAVAVEGAAAAHAALSAAQGISAVAGTGAAGAGIAKMGIGVSSVAAGIGVGVPTLVAGGLTATAAVAPMYYEMAIRKMMGKDATGGPITGFTGKVASLPFRGMSYLPEWMTPGPINEWALGSFRRERESKKELTEIEEAEKRRQESREIGERFAAHRATTAATVRQEQLRGVGLPEAKTEYAAAAAEYERLKGVPTPDATMKAASSRLVESLQRVRGLWEQQGKVVADLTTQQKNLATQIEAQQRGTKQAFGAMSRRDQWRLVRAMEKPIESRTREENQLIMSLAPEGGATAKAIGAERERRADLRGFQQLPFEQEIAAVGKSREAEIVRAMKEASGDAWRGTGEATGKEIALQLDKFSKTLVKTFKEISAENEKRLFAEWSVSKAGMEVLKMNERSIGVGVGLHP